MVGINNLKLKTLKETRDFYDWELKRKENLTETERSKYLLARKAINKIIKKKEESGEKEKKNPFLGPEGNLNLIERFPKYKDKRKKRSDQDEKRYHNDRG